jgi:Protein of unknown function (DUF2914)
LLHRGKVMKTIIVAAVLWIFFIIQAFAQSPEAGNRMDVVAENGGLTLVHAAMCEKIKDYEPYNEAIVFSIAIGKVSCFTSFDNISAETFVYHKWYRRDKLNTKKRLVLRPPRWSTFSSIQLREVDKGPWRVEITDPEENVLKILRFSITD